MSAMKGIRRDRETRDGRLVRKGVCSSFFMFAWLEVKASSVATLRSEERRVGKECPV